MIAGHRFQTTKTPLQRLLAAFFLAALFVLPIRVAADAVEVLGAGDTVRVTVFQHPDLSGDLRLAAGGTVVLPLVGEIALAGQTPTEAGAAIAARLAKGHYVVDPRVSVALIEVRSREVSVLGQVARPGQYPLDRPSMRLTDILALAGGISPSGDDRVIAIVSRDGKPRRVEIDVPAMYRSGDLSANIELESGDAIFVPSAPVFYVYGEVQRAGAYRLEHQTSVMRALALAGGLTPRGTQHGLTIHRQKPDGAVRKIHPKLNDLMEAGDVLQVPESLF